MQTVWAEFPSPGLPRWQSGCYHMPLQRRVATSGSSYRLNLRAQRPKTHSWFVSLLCSSLNIPKHSSCPKSSEQEHLAHNTHMICRFQTLGVSSCRGLLLQTLAKVPKSSKSWNRSKLPSHRRNYPQDFFKKRWSWHFGTPKLLIDVDWCWTKRTHNGHSVRQFSRAATRDAFVFCSLPRTSQMPSHSARAIMGHLLPKLKR